ncbi:MAG: deoxyribose-phosphate aldolase [Clostridia bacterium]|nr:deoxyribose-phosphate aldolase [Clostridia bacterium]
MNLTDKTLAGMIDQTLLKPFATLDQFEAFCRQADEYGFKMVAINSAMTHICKDFLKDSQVLVGAAIGFPLGQTTIEDKVFETRNAILEGADEIDYVVNLVQLKSGNVDYVKREMEEIVAVCRRYGKTSKVIFENCYLTDEEKETLCRIALEVRPDFIKTSTGFGTGSATVEDVRLMKRMVGDEIGIKAAGGMRTLDDALAMIEAGATRLGTSAGVAIVDEFCARMAK